MLPINFEIYFTDWPCNNDLDNVCKENESIRAMKSRVYIGLLNCNNLQVCIMRYKLSIKSCDFIGLLNHKIL